MQEEDEAAAPFEQLFATETMAELSARQGRVADAVAIYKHLLAGLGNVPPDDARRTKWARRLDELGRAEPVGGRRQAAARRPALSTAASESVAVPTLPPAAAPSPTHRMPMVIRQPVRSGQIIYAENTDLIVLAPVNPGAQLLADGNIHAYGPLRGRAVAGARGASDAQVFCLGLEAELVGVDVGYLPSDEISPALWGKPARVFLRDGQCLIEPLAVPAASAKDGADAGEGERSGWRWPRRRQT